MRRLGSREARNHPGGSLHHIHSKLGTVAFPRGPLGGGFMFSVRPLRLALLSLIVLLVVPAAAVKAAPRMPIGFFDDPSFRWANASAITENLAAAKKAHSTIIHVLADWRQIAPDKP